MEEGGLVGLVGVVGRVVNLAAFLLLFYYFRIFLFSAGIKDYDSRKSLAGIQEFSFLFLAGVSNM